MRRLFSQCGAMKLDTAVPYVVTQRKHPTAWA